MTKAAGCLPFAAKSTQPFTIVANFRRQDFYRDAITEQNMARQVNGAHSTFAQQRFDFVLTVEDGADKGGGIFFQDLSVNGAETNAVVVLSFANGAVLHVG